jgi:hypothetical protein
MIRRLVVAGVVALVLACGLPTLATAQLTLVASAARTASGTSTAATQDFSDATSAVFFLSVTAAATEVDDTLDVFVQASPDGGTTWDDVAHFTQVLGNGGAKKFLARWVREIAPTAAQAAPQDAAVAAGVAQGPHGPTWRVKWVVVNPGGGAASFTFAVTARVTRRR